MIQTRKILFALFALAGLIVFSSWGSEGHRKINEHAPASLPAEMQFLKASWTILLADHASDADLRKEWEPATEPPRHFLNIDDYPEFMENGKIPQDFDSVVALHGISFVLSKGILPWATIIAFDSLRNCFQRLDWQAAGLFASDLGHYVGDGHQPLHLTRNFNGQYSSQDGIHSRYESHMIGDYLDQINYNDDTVSLITDVSGYVFSYIYSDYYAHLELLRADSTAASIAGSTHSSQYYSVLWDSTKNLTINLFKHASYSLAGLIYTAWIEAGSPVMPANAIDELTSGGSFKLKVFPNPINGQTKISFINRNTTSNFLLQVYDAMGNVVTTLCDNKLIKGLNEIRWDATGYTPGLYYIRLKTDDRAETIKAVLIH